MAEFFNVLSPEDAKQLMLSHLTHRTEEESIPTAAAQGRVSIQAIVAPHDLPTFRRSTMDGYAVRASDTYGASASLPAILEVVGEVQMGALASMPLTSGQATIIHTGGMVPEDADAVVQIESTQRVAESAESLLPFEIEVFQPVAVGQNVIQIGEDVRKGAAVVPAGHVIRAQDIGGMLAVGIAQVRVYRKPRVGIMATGDELVEPEAEARSGQVRDINSFTIGALVERHGGIPEYCGIIKDSYELLLNAAKDALNSLDMLVITAGSSVSTRDITVQVMDQLGAPGVLLHGVATRPGKPTVIGAVDGKPVLGLPGNPVSAMVQFLVIGLPALYRIQGAAGMPKSGFVRGTLTRNVPSASGREDYVPVRLVETNEGVSIEPVFGKSNLIYTLVNADGLLKVPINLSGYEAGDWGEVLLF